MAKTALQLVNLALAELREVAVENFSSTYAALCLQKVNQAKREVENTQPWDCLRTVITFPTVSGTETYNLGTGGVGSGGTTNERSYLVKDRWGREMAYDTTNKTQLQIVDKEYHRSLSQLDQMTNARPGPFSLIAANTGFSMRLYPPPDGIYTITTTWVIPQPDFTATGTEISVPHEPVYLLAAAMLVEERGDGMGTKGADLRAAAAQALSDHMQFGRSMSELVCYVD
jgi:hypothetical protein